MATKNMNTKDTMSKPSVSDAELKLQIKQAGAALKGQKLVPFSIPPALERHIGTELFIAINGTKVVIPVDGKSYDLPEDLAKLGQQTINRLTT